MMKFNYIRSPALMKAYRAIPCTNCGRDDGKISREPYCRNEFLLSKSKQITRKNSAVRVKIGAVHKACRPHAPLPKPIVIRTTGMSNGNFNVSVGGRFTRLLVLELIPDRKNPKAKCICDCGQVVTPQRGALKNGRAKSCGCLRRELLAEALKRLTRMDDDERIRRNRAASDAWHKVNVEKNRAASRKFYSLNKSKVKVYHHRRRAQLHAAEGSVSAGREGQLMKLQQGKCACCRVSLKEVKHHIDHMTALSRGGSNDNSNLQLLCATCNLQKGAKDPIAFMQLKGFLL